MRVGAVIFVIFFTVAGSVVASARSTQSISTSDCQVTPDSLACWAARQKNIVDMDAGSELACTVTSSASGGAVSCWRQGIGTDRFAKDHSFSISGLKNPKQISLDLHQIFILDDEGVKYIDTLTMMREQELQSSQSAGPIVAHPVRLSVFVAPTEVSAQSRGVCAVDSGVLKCLLMDDNYHKNNPPMSEWKVVRTFPKLKNPRNLSSANLSTLVITGDGRIHEIETGPSKIKPRALKLPRNAQVTAVYAGGASFCYRMQVEGTERLACGGDDRWGQIAHLPKGYETQEVLGVGLAADMIALETANGTTFTGVTEHDERIAVPNVDFRSIRKMAGWGPYCLWHGKKDSQLTCWGDHRYGW